MKNKYIKDVINFVKENSELFYNYLNKLEQFPYVCDTSSFILGGYLKYKYPEIRADIKIIDGFYGNDLERHWWIDIGEYKIDFTVIQFHQREVPDKEFYCELKAPYLIDKYTHPNIYKDYDYDSYSIDDDIDDYIDIAKLSKSFDEYLEEVFGLYE